VICPKCQAEILDILETNGVCPACGATLPVAEDPNPALNSVMADLSVVLGILGLSFGFCFAPLAIFLGWRALVAIRRGEGRLLGKKTAIAGIVLGAFGILIIFLLILPSYTMRGDALAKVARVQADCRELSAAAGSYRTDHGTYPGTSGELTTPAAYMTALPRDAFALRPEGSAEKPALLYAPCNARLAGGRTVYDAYLVASVELDGVRDIAPDIDLPGSATLTVHDVQSRLLDKTYDPTNGTFSRGDLFRFGGFRKN
jgi:hypothetical protein